MKKRHKLILITPSGKEYMLGFIAPSRDGFVIGTPKLKEIDTSHLTVLYKKGTISSHITPQEGEEKPRYFTPLELKKVKRNLHAVLEKKLITPIPLEEMSQEVLYVTKKGVNWYNDIQSTLFQERSTPETVIHIMNVKSLMEKLPKLIEEFTKSPLSYFGLCKTSQILKDKSKILGITKTRLAIIPFKRRLYGVDLSLLTNFNFRPTLNGEQVSAPINEIFQSMGLPQYLEEIMKKKFLETIFSNEKLESE